jgi:Trk K+ transport system NAD-binding subunit
MQRLHRAYRYALFLLGRFKYLVFAALVTFCVATTVFWFFHPDQHNPATRKNLGEIMFGVFELMFVSEPALPYPKGSLLSQLVYCALPVLNILGIAAAVAQFSQVLFDKSLYNVAQADHADRHVILCGLGRLGREVLRQLDRRHDVKRRRDVVIIENGSGVDEVDTDLISREPIIPVVRGNMTHAGTLRDAGIARATAVVMLTGNDTTNLEAALLAHELNPEVRVVLRMSNSRVSERLEAMLGRGRVRNFQLIDSVEGSAPRCIDLCDGHVGDGVAGAVVEGAGAAASGSRPVVVCGLGRLGIGVVRQLKGRVPLVVVDNAERVHHADDIAMTGDHPVPLVRGDMTARRVLHEAGAHRAGAVLVLTPNDTENLEAAMLVHEMNPGARIVMRISNSRISRRLDAVLRDAFGATLRVIDPSEHAATHFIEAITEAYAAATAGSAAAPRPAPLAPRNVPS